MFKQLNVNPANRKGNDCTIRAISLITGDSWEDTYLDLCLYGLRYYDMPSSNYVWGAYLTDKGFQRKIIPNTCPKCYSVKQFASDHKSGEYILALHGHVVAVINGTYYDSWDSGNEIPIYYWQKGD